MVVQDFIDMYHSTYTWEDMYDDIFEEWSGENWSKFWDIIDYISSDSDD
jgi:hypothetical protein